MQQNKSETVSRAVLAFVIMKCQAPSHSSSHKWRAKYWNDGYFVLCRQRIQTMLSKCCWTWGPIWASTGSSTRQFLRWWFGKQNQRTGPLPRLSEGVPRGICQIDRQIDMPLIAFATEILDVQICHVIWVIWIKGSKSVVRTRFVVPSLLAC